MAKIFLLGDVRIYGPKGSTANIPTRRAEELFAFLVLESGRMFSRSVLAGQFWEDLPEERARRALNTELWRLGAALRAVGIDKALVRGRREIGFRLDPATWVDAHQLMALRAVTGRVRPEKADAAALETVENAIRAYRGDLLESAYSDWCLIRRESLRAQFVEALGFMLDACMARREWARALHYARRLLELDPLMEHVHRAAMRCHFHNGDRPLALQQYAACERVLRAELGVAPMEETRLVRQAVLAAQATSAPQAGPRGPAAATDPGKGDSDRRLAARKLQMALSDLNSARGWIEEIEQDLGAASDSQN